MPVLDKKTIDFVFEEKLLIGMPVFNGERFVSKALDSLLKQDYSNFNILISDNASTDNTGNICKMYAENHPQIYYYEQSINLGALGNFSFLLKHANSKYFMWAAYDDLWSHNFISEGLKLLDEDDVMFVFPSFVLESIYLRIKRRIPLATFRFIESESREERLLQYLNLHGLSHKANIVYSLFNTQFLKAAYEKQDISKDTVLGAVILGMGRGRLNRGIFYKRYPIIFPGMVPASIMRLRSCLFEGPEVKSQFLLSLYTISTSLRALFPEFASEIDMIFRNYRRFKYRNGFKILDK